MKKATVGKRIGAFILDSLIVGLVMSIFSSILQDPKYKETVLAIEEAYLNGTIDMFQYMEQLETLVDPNLWLQVLVQFAIAVGYFILLPIFWKDQTIGRKLTKIKVVKENGEPASAKNFIIREAIGQTIVLNIFILLTIVIESTLIVTIYNVVEMILGLVLIIGFFTMCGEKKTTLYDRFAKTIVVSADTPIEDDILDVKDAPVQEDVIDLD